MDFATLRSANLSRCARWHPRGLSEWSLSDWFTATMGELGEAANIAKKLNRERDGLAGNTQSADDLRKELADEIADVAIYLDILAASEGIDLASAIASKFNRTSEKVGFPERLPERCDFCGVRQAEDRTGHCAPPFDARPHAFTGKHPADRRLASLAAAYTEDLQTKGRIE
jgi:NTP pyrophosphatase (non-canonical NTP hydrolase)